MGEFLVICALAGLLGCGLPLLLFHETGVHLGSGAFDTVPVGARACGLVFLGSLVLGGLVTLLPAYTLTRNSAITLLENR